MHGTSESGAGARARIPAARPLEPLNATATSFLLRPLNCRESRVPVWMRGLILRLHAISIIIFGRSNGRFFY